MTMRSRWLQHAEPGETWRRERVLMAAVLEDAFRVVADARRRRRTVRTRLVGDVWNWLRADDAVGTFSFRNVCDVLDLDPDAVRRRLVEESRT